MRKRQAGVWEEGTTPAESEGELETPLVIVEKQTEATALGRLVSCTAGRPKLLDAWCVRVGLLWVLAEDGWSKED